MRFDETSEEELEDRRGLSLSTGVWNASTPEPAFARASSSEDVLGSTMTLLSFLWGGLLVSTLMKSKLQ